MTMPFRLIYAVKLFTAAMIAFVISVRVGLPQNYWPIVTCCVLANPISANVRARSIYRIVGTFCGGVACVVLAAVFGSIPLLMVICGGILTAATFTIAIIDRTPRNYGYLLFGLTLMLVLITGINRPIAMFDTAVARVLEIGLGILATGFVDAVIAPRSLGPDVRKRVDGWIADMESWLGDTLHGAGEDAEGAADRVKAIADMTSFSALGGQLRYDTGISDRERLLLFAIQRRMLRLVPYISAIGARIAQVEDDIRGPMLANLAAVWERVQNGQIARADIAASIDLPALPESESEWRHIVRGNTAEIVTGALELWCELHLLQSALDTGAKLPGDLEDRLGAAKPFPLLPDYHVAFRVGAAIALTYASLCVLWGLTGWDQVPGMFLLSIVTLGFFGAQDSADKVIVHFSRFAFLSLVLAAVLNYALLPMATSLGSFILVMGIYIVPIAMFAAGNPMGTLILATSLSLINLQSRYTPRDFGFFIDSVFAALLGIFIAYFVINMVRRMGSAHALQRFASAARADLVSLTHKGGSTERDAFIDRTLDRIGVMNTRMATLGETEQSAALLARLRAGVNIAELHEAALASTGAIRQRAEHLLDILREEIGKETPAPRLLSAIDETLTEARRKDGTETPNHPTQPLERSLVGLRLALFENASAWEPAT